MIETDTHPLNGNSTIEESTNIIENDITVDEQGNMFEESSSQEENKNLNRNKIDTLKKEEEEHEKNSNLGCVLGVGLIIILIIIPFFTFGEAPSIVKWILWFIVFIILIKVFSFSADESTKREKTAKKIYSIIYAEQRQISKEILSISETKKQQLISCYGDISKEISLDPYDINKNIIAFERGNRIWLCGNDFAMKDILQASCQDNQTIKHGDTTMTTKTNTGNMIARGIIGSAVLGGAAGAIVGGTTAKKETIVNKQDDIITHDYTIIVTVNSISNPIIKIPIGKDEDLTNSVMALLRVIISRN